MPQHHELSFPCSLRFQMYGPERLVIVSPRERVTAQAAASLVGEDTAGAGEKQPEEQV